MNFGFASLEMFMKIRKAEKLCKKVLFSNILGFWNRSKISNFLEPFSVPKFEKFQFSALESVPKSAISFFSFGGRRRITIGATEN